MDSQTLAWCVRREGVQSPTPDQIQRAEWLLEELAEMNAQLILPSIVVSEYLVPIDPARHAAVIASMSKRFLIKPFDVHCASLAARLFAHGKANRPQNIPMGRECVRSDAMIIATAVVHNAKLFYTDDGDCLKLAKTTRLDARGLPLNSVYLFKEKDSRKKKPR